jgi:DNA modification methylase
VAEVHHWDNEALSSTQGEHVETPDRVLYCRDNADALNEIPDDSVDLIYLDPPFFSNRVYEVIWGDEAEVRSFEDRWEGGMRHYIAWMRHRVLQLHRVLRPTGSIYLHCDPHASHYLKIMLDEIFGMSYFRNEIVWRRTGAHGKSRRYAPIHDTILFYTKTNDYTWNRPKRPYMRGHVEEFFVQDSQGWRTNYYGNVLTGSGRRGGLSGQPWRGIDPSSKERHWAIPGALVEEVDEDLSGLNQHQKLDRLLELGYITLDPNAAWPMYQHYIRPHDGTPAPDLWTYQPYTEGTVFGTEEGVDADVRWLSTRDRERLGYPTQKPEALLARIIRASSNGGDTVLDPFCGCGTTVSVAEKLNRNWIGIDISPTAVNLMRDRLNRIGNVRPFQVLNMPETQQDLRALKPFEFQNWVIAKFVGTHSPRKSGDMGIDGYSFFEHNPIQVKRSDRVGRNVIDNFETAMRRGHHTVGYIVGFSFTRGAHEEVARAKWHDGLEIRLRTVADLLKPQLKDQIPELGQVVELPLPPSRPRQALPSPDELIASDLAG